MPEAYSWEWCKTYRWKLGYLNGDGTAEVVIDSIDEYDGCILGDNIDVHIAAYVVAMHNEKFDTRSVVLTWDGTKIGEFND